jgi:hypothetical protein
MTRRRTLLLLALALLAAHLYLNRMEARLRADLAETRAACRIVVGREI